MGKWTDLARTLSSSQPLANSANRANSSDSDPKRGAIGTNGTNGTGVEKIKRDKSSPESEPTEEAAADALTLAAILDEDPEISLDDIRSRAAAEGIDGQRFAHGLAALPPKYDAGATPRSPKEKLDAFLDAQPKPAGEIAGDVLDELKIEKKPLPQDLKKWPAGPRYVCALLVRRGKSQERAINAARRWWLLGADLRAALAMGWADAEALLKDAGVQCEGGVG